MDPIKTKAVSEWPIPTSLKELLRFLGFGHFYCRFIRLQLGGRPPHCPHLDLDPVCLEPSSRGNLHHAEGQIYQEPRPHHVQCHQLVYPRGWCLQYWCWHHPVTGWSWQQGAPLRLLLSPPHGRRTQLHHQWPSPAGTEVGLGGVEYLQWSNLEYLQSTKLLNPEHREKFDSTLRIGLFSKVLSFLRFLQT